MNEDEAHRKHQSKVREEEEKQSYYLNLIVLSLIVIVSVSSCTYKAVQSYKTSLEVEQCTL